jgi:ribosomal RNA-processing protein 8
MFDVPGWSVPSDPVSTQRQSKKRKHAASSEEQDLLRNAQVNLDKLVDSLGGSADNAGDGSSKKKKKKKINKPTSQPSHRNQRGEGLQPHGKPHGQTKASVPSAEDPSTTSDKAAWPSKKAKKKNTKRVVQPTDTPKHSAAVQDTGRLTPLQRSLRNSLDGARFRFVLEYTEIHWIDLFDDLDC